MSKLTAFLRSWGAIILVVLIYGACALYGSYTGATEAVAEYEKATGKRVSIWSAMWTRPEIPPSAKEKRRSDMREYAVRTANAADAVSQAARLLISKIDEGASIEVYDEDRALASERDMRDAIARFLEQVQTEVR